MTIGAVPIFHKKKYQMKWLLEQYPFFIKKKYQMKWLLEQYPFFIQKKVSDEMTIGAVPILH